MRILINSKLSQKLVYTIVIVGKDFLQTLDWFTDILEIGESKTMLVQIVLLKYQHVISRYLSKKKLMNKRKMVTNYIIPIQLIGQFVPPSELLTGMKINTIFGIIILNAIKGIIGIFGKSKYYMIFFIIKKIKKSV